MRPADQKISSLIFSGLFAYAMMGVLSSGLVLPDLGSLRIISGLSYRAALIVLAAWLLFSIIRACSARERRLHLPAFSPLVFLTAALVLTVSDFSIRRNSFFFGTDTAFYSLLSFFLIVPTVSLLHPPLIRKIGNAVFSFKFLVLVQLFLTATFLRFSDGRLIFSDDHPSFLYRLQLLRDHFPNVLFYNTDWNAGYPTSDILFTGAASVYLIAWPVLRFVGDIRTWSGAWAYDCLLPYLFIIVVPLSLYLAARFAGLSRRGSAIAALLGIAPTTLYFDYAFKFGTLSFCLSAGLFPLTSILVYRLFFGRPAALTFAVGTALTTGLCLMWSPMALAFLPLGLAAIYQWRSILIRARLTPLLLTAVVSAAILASGPLLLIREGRLAEVANQSSLPGASVQRQVGAVDGKADKRDGGTAPLEHFNSHRKLAQRLLGATHPLLLALAVPAMFSVRRRRVRRLLFAICSWLLLLALFGEDVRPLLELRRMALPLAFLICLPVAAMLDSLLGRALQKSRLRRPSAMFTSAALLALTVAGVFKNWEVNRGRSGEYLHFAPAMTADFIKVISEQGGSGRTFFLGFILHEFGAADYRLPDGGHIAPLAQFTHRPLYANHFYHYFWWTVDPIPVEFRNREDAGTEEFLDLMNASSVVTFRSEWVNYCKAHANYQEIFHGDHFRIFSRSSAKLGYVFRGAAEVHAERDRIIVTPQSEEVVIKFRYRPRLKVNLPQGAVIFPVPMFHEESGYGGNKEVSFIGLKASPDIVAGRTPIIIGYDPS